MSSAFDAVIESYAHIQSARLSTFSATTLIFYDYFISFDQEVEFVWKRDWSIIKVVFIWHRYFGIFSAIMEIAATMSSTVTDQSDGFFFESSCHFWFRWETWGYVSVVFTTEVVLVLWIFVVYDKNLRILAFMGCLLVCEVIAVVVILARSFLTLSAGAHLIPGIAVCAVERAPDFFYSLWTPILVYNAVLLLFFLYRGYRVYALGSEARKWKSSSMLASLYKYSLLNFLVIVASYLVCAVMWQGAKLGLGQIPVGFALSLSIISSSRLLLNIRHAYYTRLARATRNDTKILDFEEGSDEILNTLDPDVMDEARLAGRTPSIYAGNTARELWAFELREIKFSGFD